MQQLILVAAALGATEALVSPVRPSVSTKLRSTTDPLSSSDSKDVEGWESTRKVVGCLATCGVVETTYLTSQKVLGGLAMCSSADCSSVLTGPYSSIGGVPVSFLGLVSYLAVLGLCVAPSFFPRWERRARLPLVFTTAAMAGFSAWLVALLVLKLQAFCAFCFASAAVSWSNFALTAQQQRRDSAIESGNGAAVAGIFASTFAALVTFYLVETGVALDEARTLMAGGGGTSSVVVANNNAKDSGPLVFDPPTVDTPSSPEAIALAKHLKAKGAKMYGAYWCSHCFDQKRAFGSVAVADIDYIECAEDGANSKRGDCQARGINGYPTWEIDGKLYPGEKSLNELATISGFK